MVPVTHLVAFAASASTGGLEPPLEDMVARSDTIFSGAVSGERVERLEIDDPVFGRQVTSHRVLDVVVQEPMRGSKKAETLSVFLCRWDDAGNVCALGTHTPWVEFEPGTQVLVVGSRGPIPARIQPSTFFRESNGPISTEASMDWAALKRSVSNTVDAVPLDPDMAATMVPGGQTSVRVLP